MVGPDAANATAASVPAFGSGGLRIQLARAAAGGAPFVVLHEGQHGRVMLGEVRIGAAMVARFAWKLRAERTVTAAGQALANGEVDARWQRERQAMLDLRSVHVVAPFPVPAELLQSPPLWFCARTEQWFHPVCPDSGALLRVCRDDELLNQCGLPGYAVDTERYLHSGVPGAARVFYQPQAAASRRTVVDVRHREQLVAGFGALVHAPAGDARAVRAAAALPCLSCPQRLQCYPVGVEAAALPAQQALHAVSFFDVDAIASEWHTFDFDEACALLGGGDLDEVVAARAPAGLEIGTGRDVCDGLSGPGQWLFADQPARWSVEVALRKVDAFLQLLDGLAAVHATGRPHLGLAPTNVLASWRAGSQPARWGMRIALHDLGSAVQKALPTPGGEQWFEPGGELLADLRCRPYTAPALQAVDGLSLSLAVTCYRTGEHGGSVNFVIEGQGAGVPRSARTGDFVVVQPIRGGAALVAQLQEARARGLLASAALPEGHPCLQWDGHAFEARVAFHRRVGFGADCHGLGVLLLRALVVDDEQGIDEVMEVFGLCMRWLEAEPAAVRSDPVLLSARLQQLLVGREVRERLQPGRLLHRRADRDAYDRAVAAGARPFDAELWSGLLAVVCRLLANWPQGSFATGVGDGDAAVVGRVRAEVELLRRRLAVELLDASARDASVAAAASRWLLEHVAAEAAGGAASAAGGFTLVVARESGEPVQTVAFATDRVTIGKLIALTG